MNTTNKSGFAPASDDDEMAGQLRGVAFEVVPHHVDGDGVGDVYTIELGGDYACSGNLAVAERWCMLLNSAITGARQHDIGLREVSKNDDLTALVLGLKTDRIHHLERDICELSAQRDALAAAAAASKAREMAAEACEHTSWEYISGKRCRCCGDHFDIV